MFVCGWECRMKECWSCVEGLFVIIMMMDGFMGCGFLLNLVWILLCDLGVNLIMNKVFVLVLLVIFLLSCYWMFC